MYCNVLCTSLSSVANWGLPLAALADMKKDADIISPKMTTGKLCLGNYIRRYTKG